jgi:hypothetical protein
MKTFVRVVVLAVFAVIAVPFGLYLFVRSRIRTKPRRQPPPTEQEVSRAEKRLGFGLPADLRAHFLAERPRIARGCAELYRLNAAVREYGMLTKRPYGPNGQDWPSTYFPVADLLPGYGLYDLATGTIVEWDPEDLGDEDDNPALWDRSFTPTGLALQPWLQRSEAA